MKKILLIIFFFSPFLLNSRILDDKNYILDVLYKQFAVTNPVFFTSIKEPSIYQINFDNNTYIVRLNGEYNIFARAVESALHLYAAEKGFGPAILYTDPKEEIIIMEKLESPAVIPSNIDEFLPHLVEAIHLMHQAPFSGRQIHKFTTNILNRVMSLNDRQRRDIHTIEIYGNLLKLAPLFNNDEEVLVHGDLNPFNIFISKNKCTFIDFETPHLDSPFVDLAHVALVYGMNKEQEKNLLTLYFNREITAIDFVKLTAMKCFVCAKLVCWMLESVTPCYNSERSDILDFSQLEYTPPLHLFLTEHLNISDPQLRYKIGISAIKELEELLQQLDLCILGNTSLVMPTSA